MRAHVTSDGALGGRRLAVGDVGGWLTSVFRAEAAFCLGRDLAAAVRDFILRGVPGCGATRIRVSGMSDRWLGMHVTEYDKHRTEL